VMISMVTTLIMGNGLLTEDWPSVLLQCAIINAFYDSSER
jgi:hypothetical protein